NQLVKQYMRVSKFGIFLLVYQGVRKWEHPVSKQRIFFTELAVLLKQKANILIGENPSIDSLEVFGIDLTARSGNKVNKDIPSAQKGKPKRTLKKASSKRGG
ncbi:MAG: hypothetical protein ACYC9O_16285, partial [Candidatus Latescibacterota bacterium]